jgi:hypothetical protein
VSVHRTDQELLEQPSPKRDLADAKLNGPQGEKVSAGITPKLKKIWSNTRFAGAGSKSRCSVKRLMTANLQLKCDKAGYKFDSDRRNFAAGFLSERTQLYRSRRAIDLCLL